jgi:predicted transcriptional regulator
MLRDTTINSGEIYIGRNSGERILDDIASATESVKIVTPYISETYIDLLLEKAKSGVDVSLIFTDDFVAAPAKRNKIFRKLIWQIQHLYEKEQKLRSRGLTSVIFGYIAVVLLAVYLPKTTFRFMSFAE